MAPFKRPQGCLHREHIGALLMGMGYKVGL